MTSGTEDTQEKWAELGSLPDDASRKNFLKHFPQWLDIQTLRELDEAVRGVLRVDVRKQKALSRPAFAIAAEIELPEATALALRAKANTLYLTGECGLAAQFFEEATKLFEQSGNKSEAARTLSSSIQSLALTGEYDAAFTAAERARKIFTGLGESWRVARVDINEANIYHRQNRYAEALATYERAYRQLIPHRDMEATGVALHNMAVCLIALDDFKGAMETYRRVRAFCEQHEMPLLVAQADYNIAFLHYLRGDYNTALKLLRSTREVCRDNGDAYHSALCDLDQSEIYLELSLIDEASEMAQNSFTQFEQLNMGFEVARSLTNLAIAATLRREPGRALELFTRAKEIAASENNRVWPNLIDLYRALVS